MRVGAFSFCEASQAFCIVIIVALITSTQNFFFHFWVFAVALFNMFSSLNNTGSGLQMVWSVLGQAVLALGESVSVHKKSQSF